MEAKATCGVGQQASGATTPRRRILSFTIPRTGGASVRACARAGRRAKRVCAEGEARTHCKEYLAELQSAGLGYNKNRHVWRQDPHSRRTHGACHDPEASLFVAGVPAETQALPV